MAQTNSGPIVARHHQIVWWLTASTRSSCTSRSAKSLTVHLAWPVGAGLQAKAKRCASCGPPNRGALPGRGRSLRAASMPSSAKRCRMRAIVPVLTPTLSAMTSSLSPSSTASKTSARFTLRTLAVPLRVRDSNCVRSSGANLTRYFFKSSSLAPRLAGKSLLLSATNGTLH